MALLISRIGAVVGAALLALLVGTAQGASAWYAVSPLDPPPGYVAFHPTSINSAGDVAGDALDPVNGARAAVIWRNGSGSDIIGTLGGTDSRAMALNDAGIVVGESAVDPGETELHAFAHDANTMRDLGTPGHNSGATAINSTGQIVGYECDSLGNAHAMIWDREVGHRLDRFDVGFSYAMAINARGQAVVTAYASGPGGSPGTYVWNNGPLTFAGAFAATAIDADGQVIGYEASPLPDLQGLLWDGRAARRIGDSSKPFLPLALNDNGLLVGSTLTSAGAEHAATWQGGVVEDLNALATSDGEWELWRATAINRAGQIVGYGAFDGQERAFMLTPAGSH